MAVLRGNDGRISWITRVYMDNVFEALIRILKEAVDLNVCITILFNSRLICIHDPHSGPRRICFLARRAAHTIHSSNFKICNIMDPQAEVMNTAQTSIELVC